MGDARAAATSRLLERLDDDGPAVIDVDASLFEVHSEQKEGATPHFKGGFGSHPMFAFVEPAALPLAGKLHEGRAGANVADDHLTVIDDAIAALPATWQAGHRVGDEPGLVRRRLRLLVRADTAGYSHTVIRWARGPQLRVLQRDACQRPIRQRDPPFALLGLAARDHR